VEKLNYEFKNKDLLALALTQSGVDPKNNNERLEFVGDRVLGLTVAKMLYDMFPDEAEGDLARRHAMLVSTETLADVAISIGLEGHVRHGHITAGRTRHMLADAIEAVFGAIYLDGGFKAAEGVIAALWHDIAARDAVAPKDPKTALQELVQKYCSGYLPEYDYRAPHGASHDPEFVVTVSAMGASAEGRGSSKKEASSNAAAALLKILAIQSVDD